MARPGTTSCSAAGNDIIYGGDGDDIIYGFTASNEAGQTLAAGETDDDFLYGGAGNDTWSAARQRLSDGGPAPTTWKVAGQ